MPEGVEIHLSKFSAGILATVLGALFLSLCGGMLKTYNSVNQSDVDIKNLTESLNSNSRAISNRPTLDLVQSWLQQRDDKIDRNSRDINNIQNWIGSRYRKESDTKVPKIPLKESDAPKYIARVEYEYE